MTSYVNAMKKYFTLSGRSPRAEYWIFQLFYNLMFLAPIYVFGIYGGYEPGEPTLLSNSAVLIPSIVLLGHIIPLVTVTVRRLQDIGASGWVILLFFIPVIGTLILLVLMCWPSSVGNNGYGANPYDIQA